MAAEAKIRAWSPFNRQLELDDDSELAGVT